MKTLFRFIHQDLKQDFRQKYALGALFLYLFSTVYVVYRVFESIDDQTWLGIYWIVYLLVALSIILRSFVLPNKGLTMYYYSLYDPRIYLAAKVIYNTLMLIFMGLILYGLLSVFSMNPVDDIWTFLLSLFLASLGISVIFSFVSSISASQHQNSVMMAILALPLIIPVLLLSLHISGKSLGLIIDQSLSDEISLIVGIILVMLGLGLLLFPNIWRS